jgi:hypothetical protein
MALHNQNFRALISAETAFTVFIWCRQTFFLSSTRCIERRQRIAPDCPLRWHIICIVSVDSNFLLLVVISANRTSRLQGHKDIFTYLDLGIDALL